MNPDWSALDKIREVQNELTETHDFFMSIDMDGIYVVDEKDAKGEPSNNWMLVRYGSILYSNSTTPAGVNWPTCQFKILASEGYNSWQLQQELGPRDRDRMRLIKPEEYPLYMGGTNTSEEFTKLLAGDVS